MLPDTPQGKTVKAYLEAFNSGDEAKFVKAQEDLMAADALARHPPADRAKMYKRMRRRLRRAQGQARGSHAAANPRGRGRQ